jgi:hypothetical protein
LALGSYRQRQKASQFLPGVSKRQIKPRQLSHS